VFERAQLQEFQEKTSCERELICQNQNLFSGKKKGGKAKN